MIKRIALIAFVALLLGVGSIGYAQSDPALLAAVTQAFDQTRASASLHIETQSLVVRDGGRGQQSSSTWDMTAVEAGWNLSGSQTTVLQMGEIQIETTMQYKVVDGVTYMNLDGVQGMPGGQGTQELPQGWFVLTDDGMNPPMFGQVENLANQALGGLEFPISAESVTAIVELPGDTLNGQAMRIYQLSLDAQALLSFGRGGFGGMPPVGGQNAPPTDGQNMPPGGGQRPDFGQALDPSAIQITFAVYVGQDDGLIHRIYSVIETAFSGSDGAQSTTTATVVSDFTVPAQAIEIAAPEVSA